MHDIKKEELRKVIIEEGFLALLAPFAKQYATSHKLLSLDFSKRDAANLWNKQIMVILYFDWWGV